MIKRSSINREFTEFTTTATKTLLKKWICAASNFTALISSRLIRQMFFFCNWLILKDCIKVQEMKKKLLPLVPVLDKMWN